MIRHVEGPPAGHPLIVSKRAGLNPCRKTATIFGARNQLVDAPGTEAMSRAGERSIRKGLKEAVGYAKRRTSKAGYRVHVPAHRFMSSKSMSRC